jgi:NADH:ubiquinone oxidoreductase subunit 3 (subunit A)
MSFYDSYAAIMIATIAGFILVATALIATRVLAPYATERAKGVSYECGMLPIGRNWAQVHVRYYILAILFLIFDVETVFIFPWAVRFIDAPDYVFYEMLVFIAVLALGLAYAWRRGVLEWGR